MTCVTALKLQTSLPDRCSKHRLRLPNHPPGPPLAIPDSQSQCTAPGRQDEVAGGRRCRHCFAHNREGRTGCEDQKLYQFSGIGARARNLIRAPAQSILRFSLSRHPRRASSSRSALTYPTAAGSVSDQGKSTPSVRFGAMSRSRPLRREECDRVSERAIGAALTRCAPCPLRS